MTFTDASGKTYVRAAGARGVGKTVVVETVDNGRRRPASSTRPNTRVSRTALRTACELAYKNGGADKRDTPAEVAGQAYVNLWRVYEQWQYQRQQDDGSYPNDLQAELTCGALMARYLFAESDAIDHGRKVPHINFPAKPCDLLSLHMSLTADMLHDEGECGYDRAQKRALLTSEMVNRISRAMLKNCCLQEQVRRLDAIVSTIMPEYVPVDPQTVPNHLAGRTNGLRSFMRDQTAANVRKLG